MEITYGVLTQETSTMGLYIFCTSLVSLFTAIVCGITGRSELQFKIITLTVASVLICCGMYIGTVSIPNRVNEITTDFIEEYKIKSTLLENSKEEFAKSLSTIEYYNDQVIEMNNELQSFKEYGKTGSFKESINQDIYLLDHIDMITDKDIYGGE